MTDSLRRRSPVETAYGPLEVRVLDALWARTSPACVRDLQPAIPYVAYTTLMTTLDRLFRKGVLARHKRGRAFHYHTLFTRAELQSRLAGSAFASMLPGESGDVRPILSLFVDAVGERDRSLLDDLESMVRARRDELKGKAPK